MDDRTSENKRPTGAGPTWTVDVHRATDLENVNFFLLFAEGVTDRKKGAPQTTAASTSKYRTPVATLQN